MQDFLTIGFLAILIGLSLLALRMWYTRRGASVSDAERRVFGRFILGLSIFWGVAIAAYFLGPLFSALR